MKVHASILVNLMILFVIVAGIAIALDSGEGDRKSSKDEPFWPHEIWHEPKSNPRTRQRENDPRQRTRYTETHRQQNRPPRSRSYRWLSQTLGCTSNPCVVNFSGGGVVSDFKLAAQEVIQGDITVIINGGCHSACVILADIASRKVCMTPKANFGFHKTGMGYRDRNGKTVFDWYGPRADPTDHSFLLDLLVRMRGGYYDGKDMNVFSHWWMRLFWRMCTEKDWSGR